MNLPGGKAVGRDGIVNAVNIAKIILYQRFHGTGWQIGASLAHSAAHFIPNLGDFARVEALIDLYLNF